MSKTARIIITFDCDRGCEYCCNNYESIINNGKKVDNLSFVENYNEICITGGEPMLKPLRTISIINDIKKYNPNAKIYLYTALYKDDLKYLLPLIDGVHFTLHANSTTGDINSFQKYQDLIWQYNEKGNFSFRLYIHQKTKHNITIYPSLYSRMEIKDWVNEEECELPINEDLFILNKGAEC